MQKSRILVVAKEEISAMEVNHHIEQMGFEPVDVIGTAENILGDITISNPDVVIFSQDLTSNRDIFLIADKIVSEFQLPVIFICSENDVKIITKTSDKTIYNYVTRPVIRESLRKVIVEALKNVKSPNTPVKVDLTTGNCEKRYRSMMYPSLEAIFLFQDNRLRLVNPEAFRLLGYEESETDQLSLGEVIFSKDMKLFLSLVENPNDNKKYRNSIAIRVVTKDNKHRWVDAKAMPLTGVEPPGFLIVVHDISERKQSEALLIQMEKVLMIAGLTPGIVHELNNPLGVILHGTQNIRRRLSQDIDPNLEAARLAGINLDRLQTYLEKRGILSMLQNIQDSVIKAGKIVTGMLEFSRKSESIMVPTNLESLVEGALELSGKDFNLKKKYDFRKIIIVKLFDPNLPLVPCIEVEIEQVILNLLRNAAWSLMQSEMKTDPVITIRLQLENSSVRVEIEDNGPGMDEFTQSQIFSPFYTTKPKGEGTGLGLTVSRNIVQINHGGSINVESKLGKGTNFIVRLPLEQAGV